MATIISLFNHKGGVSKTTTTFHLGWVLAEIGKKVLIVDADPQCNLTGLVLNISEEEKFEELYCSRISNIKTALAPALEAKPEKLQPANCYAFPERENLHLLPGHIEFSDYDVTYNIAQELMGSLKVVRNVPGAIRYLLEVTASEHHFDIILIDMSPSITATNANILMQSDYFIVPCAPDYFCYMAIDWLAGIFPSWKKKYENIRENAVFREAAYTVKRQPPVFIGTIQQRYRPRNGAPVKSFNKWIEDISELVTDKLVPILRENNMVLDESYIRFYEEPYNLINIADFNSLIAQSQKHRVPVFSLTQEQIGQTGAVWKNMEKNRDHFHYVFKDLAEKVINLTSNS